MFAFTELSEEIGKTRGREKESLLTEEEYFGVHLLVSTY